MSKQLKKRLESVESQLPERVESKPKSLGWLRAVVIWRIAHARHRPKLLLEHPVFAAIAVQQQRGESLAECPPLEVLIADTFTAHGETLIDDAVRSLSETEGREVLPAWLASRGRIDE